MQAESAESELLSQVRFGGLGFRVQGSGFRVQGVQGFRVECFGYAELSEPRTLQSHHVYDGLAYHRKQQHNSPRLPPRAFRGSRAVPEAWT